MKGWLPGCSEEMKESSLAGNRESRAEVIS